MPTEIGELDLNAGTMRGFRPASDANVRWLEMWLENPMPKRFASARPRAVERPAWGRRHESAAPAQSVAAGETASRIAPARRNPAPLDHRPRRLPCRKAYTSESAMSNPQPLEKADRLAIRCSLPHGPSPDAHRLDRIVGDQKPDSLPPPPKSPGPGATPAALGGPATPPGAVPTLQHQRQPVLGIFAHSLRPAALSPRQVFVTHGEPAAADACRRRLRDTFGWNTIVPDDGSSWALD